MSSVTTIMSSVTKIMSSVIIIMIMSALPTSGVTNIMLHDSVGYPTCAIDEHAHSYGSPAYHGGRTEIMGRLIISY
jgi:hypothetical protein